MNISISFDGASFALGVIVAFAWIGYIPRWVVIPALLLLVNWPGPKLSYASGTGWSFVWWHNPAA